MKTFLVNIILPFIMLAFAYIMIMPIAFIFSYLIEARYIKKIIFYGAALLVVLAITFVILKLLFDYWRTNSNYNNTYIFLLLGIFACCYFGFKYLTTRNLNKFKTDITGNTVVVDPDYIAEHKNNTNLDTLFAKQNPITATYAFYDSQNRKVLGDYQQIYTDTFVNFAIILDTNFYLIDRTGFKLHEIFPYDNGPDYPSEGLYRIIKNGKIGFLDARTSQLIIEPLYEAAFPFENGKTKVSYKAVKSKQGDHFVWISDIWFFIDKSGKKID